MINRPPESLKGVATELSGLLNAGHAGDENANMLARQLEKSFTPGKKTASPFHFSIKQGVGIWQKEIRNGYSYYKRDVNKRMEWHLWADVHELPLKTKKKRILLFGESAARGFLYDPYYNVAQELQSLLDHATSKDHIEIIDLSRISMVINNMQELLKQSLQLEPDVIVIFAGNNWVYATDEMEYEFSSIWDLYKKESIQGLRSFREKELEKIVKSFFSDVEELFLKNNIPVVFIVPEFNLQDWKSNPAEQVLPAIPEQQANTWFSCRQAVQKSLTNGAGGELEEAAMKMIAADPSNPYGFELLGDYYLKNKKLEAARTCFEQSKDTILYNRSKKSMPRCVTIIRDTILSESARLGIHVVDLPAIFQNEFPDAIPGRNLFLDNCHLTLEGIQIAMRHAASVLAGLIMNVEVNPATIKDFQSNTVSDHVQAIAHFCAAIYNAHYGQGQDIIQYHCDKAISFSSDIKEVMVSYIDFSTRYAPTVLCRSFETLVQSGEMRQYENGFGLRHPRNSKLMDQSLVDAIIKSLKADGTAIEKTVNDLRMEEHGLVDKVDLLESYYSRNSYHEFFYDAEKIFLRARTIESDFLFIARNEDNITVRIVYRTPNNTNADKSIDILINNTPGNLIQLLVAENWISKSFVIDKRLLKNGVNQLTFVWPYGTSPSIPKGSVTPELFSQLVFPVLADIYQLTIEADKKIQ